MIPIDPAMNHTHVLLVNILTRLKRKTNIDRKQPKVYFGHHQQSSLLTHSQNTQLCVGTVDMTKNREIKNNKTSSLSTARRDFTKNIFSVTEYIHTYRAV